MLGALGYFALHRVLGNNFGSVAMTAPTEGLTALAAVVLVVGLAVFVPLRRSLQVEPASVLRHM